MRGNVPANNIVTSREALSKEPDPRLTRPPGDRVKRSLVPSSRVRGSPSARLLTSTYSLIISTARRASESRDDCIVHVRLQMFPSIGRMVISLEKIKEHCYTKDIYTCQPAYYR